MRRSGIRRYAAQVPIARRPWSEKHIIPFPKELEDHSGEWVAIQNHVVIHSAATSTDLARWLRDSGLSMREVSMQYVRPPADAYIVGAG